MSANPNALELPAALSMIALRAAVAELLDGDDEFDNDEDLIRRGLDSIRIMTLSDRLRRSGARVKFGELFEQPTLESWWQLVSSRVAELDQEQRPAPPNVDEFAPFALTPVQYAYWVGRSDGQTLGGVGCHFYVEFDGRAVEPARLERAVRALVQRHPLLRSRYLSDGTQQISAHGAWPGLRVHALDLLAQADVDAALEALRARLSHRRLEVERGEVFDVQLSLLPGGRTRLHVNVDLLVADVLSIQVFFTDLARLYAQPDVALPALSFGFAEYMRWKELQPTAASECARAYWQARLPELPGAPQLPLAKLPEQIGVPRFKRRQFWLPPQTWRNLEGRAHDYGVTPAMSLATAFGEVLATWSSEPRFLLNVPLFDRETIHPDVPGLIADFTSLVLLAIDASSADSFLGRARATQQQFRADAKHTDYSGVDVVRDLRRTRTGPYACAPVVFTSALGIGELYGSDFRRSFGDPGWMISQAPQVWLDHQVTQHQGGLLFNWDAVEELFPAGLLDAMFDSYVRLLDWLSGSDSDWSAAVPCLVPTSQLAERSRVNATAAETRQQLLHAAFFERATSEPEALALAWGEASTCSYGELAQRAQRLAGALRARGLQVGASVAVTLPKGPEQVVAVLGILHAGGVYVPVGVDQPASRRERIYRSAGVTLVLTSRAQQAELSWPNVMTLEDSAEASPWIEGAELTGESLAYVIYTSGSTGEPKGVEITHAAASNTIEDINTRFEVSGRDRVLAVSALDFDLSVYDVFGLLSAGGALVLVEEEQRREPRVWAEQLKRWSVTLWNSVPALLDMLLVTTQSEAEQLTPTLRLALVSGDWVGLDLPGRLAEQNAGCRLIALGGATEASIWSNAFEVERVDEAWRSIPYGYPLRNQEFRVVDSRGRDCPEWVAGEMWIGGMGVANGYRGDAERSAARFVTHDGKRYYRTGDLGRYRAGGCLEFLGRVDQQVKIRGHRIELGEVEAALQGHPALERAVAFVTGERTLRLMAAVVVKAGEPAPEALELQRWAAERLPAYAVPSACVVLDTLPLTHNGKLDRPALAELANRASDDDDASAGPRGELETVLAALWCEQLGLPSAGRHENFVMLGGDSVLATRVVEAIRARLGVEVSLREFFTSPTIAELALVVAPACGERACSPTELTVEEGIV